MNIIVIGLGGVGGYFGFKINEVNKIRKEHCVTFVAKEKTFDVVNENGLRLYSNQHEYITKPDYLCKSISEIKNPDLILICVKEYDLENVCVQLKDAIAKDTILLPMMNGVDIYDRIKKIIPENTILPSCVYVASHIKEKGVVEHKGNTGKLIFGRDANNFSRDIDWVVEILNNADFSCQFKDDASIEIWTKFIFIASFGLITAKYNSSIGEVINNPYQREEAKKIMVEIKTIAEKKKINLSKDIIEKTFNKAGLFPFETPTSLQLDINSSLKTDSELELFAGAIIKYGKTHNVVTHHTSLIYNCIKKSNNV